MEEEINLEEAKKKLLKDFNLINLQETLQEYTKGAYVQKSYKDFDYPDEKEEVKIGTDSRVPRDEKMVLERIIPLENNLLPVHFLEEGSHVQRAVARVTLRESFAGLPAGSGWGTGFLVSPSLFLTNNHVIRDTDFAKKVEMQFNYQLDFNGNPQTVDIYTTNPDDVFYTNAALDFTILRLNPRCRFWYGRDPIRPLDRFPREAMYQSVIEYTPHPDDPDPRPPGPEPPTIDPRRIRDPDFIRDTGRIFPPRRICYPPGHSWGFIQLRDNMTYTTPQHVNVIQHPRGRHKEVALQENHLTHIYLTRVRYTTDTEPGSSGSPVFDNGWDLISIHHAAGEPHATLPNTWINNEGMRIDKIVADLRNHFSGTPEGDRILQELGI
ncbi:MAG: trypsin-like serine peptidase [Candidatus Heimdallarchaeaceae archaeon]